MILCMNSASNTHRVEARQVADNMYANGFRTVYYVTNAENVSGFATASKAQRFADRMNAAA